MAYITTVQGGLKTKPFYLVHFRIFITDAAYTYHRIFNTASINADGVTNEVSKTCALVLSSESFRNPGPDPETTLYFDN